MPPKKVNPIAEKLNQLIYSGKTVNVPAARMKVTKELICVLTDLKYPTLENVFYRTEISYASLKSLKFAGLITDKDESDYRKWLLENQPKPRKKKGAQDGSTEETVDSDSEFEEQSAGAEGDDGEAVLDTGDASESDDVLPQE